MGELGTYIYYLFLIAMFCGIASLIYGGGTDAGMQKPLRFALSLCVVMALIVPIAKAFLNFRVDGEIPEINADLYTKDVFSEVKESIISQSEDYVEREIVQCVASEFHIDKEHIFADSVLLCEDTQDVKLYSVSLVINEDISAVYASNIELYLSNLLQCDVTVKNGGEKVD